MQMKSKREFAALSALCNGKSDRGERGGKVFVFNYVEGRGQCRQPGVSALPPPCYDSNSLSEEFEREIRLRSWIFGE